MTQATEKSLSNKASKKKPSQLHRSGNFHFTGDDPKALWQIKCFSHGQKHDQRLKQDLHI